MRSYGLIVKLVLWLSSLLVIAGFLANRHIYNSDNYRYLVLLVVPWAVGSGLLFGLAEPSRVGRQGAGDFDGSDSCAGDDVGYRPAGTVGLGWLDGSLRPVGVHDSRPGAGVAGSESRSRQPVRRLLGHLPAQLPDGFASAGHSLPELSEPVPGVVGQHARRAAPHTAGAADWSRAVLSARGIERRARRCSTKLQGS